MLVVFIRHYRRWVKPGECLGIELFPVSPPVRTPSEDSAFEISCFYFFSFNRRKGQCCSFPLMSGEENLF